jgi:two-component system, cell cycle response regulator
MDAVLHSELQELAHADDHRSRSYASTGGLAETCCAPQAVLRLEEELERARRYEHPLACMLVELNELDHLREALDERHIEKILDDIKEMLAYTLPPHETVARSTAGQFLIVAPRMDRRRAAACAEKAAEKVRRHRFVTAGKTFSLSVSVAACAMDSGSDEDCVSLLLRLEDALARSHETGQAEFCAPSPELEPATVA